MGIDAANDENLRPEEIIGEVYRQIRLAREEGKRPARIVMRRSSWFRIEEYRQQLGVIQGPVPDYISDDGLFGLEIWYSNEPIIRVE